MHNLDIGEINRPEVCSQYVGVHYLIMHVTLCVKSPTFHLSLLPGLFTHMFVCQTSAATQHTVIDKIQSFCTKIKTKVKSLYSVLIRKSRSDSSLDLVISDLLCERSLRL